MPRFTFVSDKDLYECVSRVIDAADRAATRADGDLSKNVLDPFAALFAITHSGIELSEWSTLERDRQVQKSIQNSIGEFHQNLLGCFKNWSNPGRGGSVDLISEKYQVIAEVKNKHNTLNSGGQNDTYTKLANHLKYDRKGFTAYLVQIVPKKADNYNQPWTPNRTTMALRDDLRKIDGESFYDLASGENDTLLRIFEAIPDIVSQIRGNTTNTAAIEECRQLFIKTYR